MVRTTTTRRGFVTTAGLLALGVAMGLAPCAWAEEAAEGAGWFPPDPDDVGLEVLFEGGDELEDPIENFPPIELPEDSPHAWLDEDEADMAGEEAPFARLPEDDGADLVFENLLLDALKKLGQAAWSTAMNYGKTSFMSIVFGDGDSSTAMMERLDEIDDKLADVDATLKAIWQRLEEGTLRSQVNKYFEDHATPADEAITTLAAFLDNQDALFAGDEDALASARLEFAEAVVAGTNPDFKVQDATMYDAVFGMADALRKASRETGLTPVEAFDRTCVLEYAWEHQAYEVRRQFRDYVCAQFVTLASYLLVSLRDYLEAHAAEKTTTAYVMASTHLQVLFGTNARDAAGVSADELGANDVTLTEDGVYGDVLRMFEDSEVEELPANQRCLQVPGCELTLYASTAVMRTSEAGGTRQAQFTHDAHGWHAVASDDVARLVAAYGGGTSLLDILFDDGEGNITPACDVDASTLFALDEPVRVTTKKVSDGYNTTVYKNYYVPVARADGRRAEALFAASTTQGKKTKWIWYDVSALGVFVVG